MNTKTIVVLTLNEVREDLCNWYADMIVADRLNVLDHIRDGIVGDICPNLKHFSANDMVETFAEFNLGEKYATVNDQVVIELDAEHYVVVWDRLNLEPERYRDKATITSA